MPPESMRFKVALRGDALLTNPRWNKGTAFTKEERIQFGLTGRLPFRVNSLDEQCDRAWGQLEVREEPLRKNTFLQSLKEQNWVLYYVLLERHLTELMPIIYTPTEVRLLLFQGSMEEDFLAETEGRQIDLIVCSDAEQILGIGDQGVGGIGIATAKAAVYTLIGGVNPANALPITLDVGTDNQLLLDDPLYVGWPNKRVRGAEYDQFIDKFVQLVRKHHPHCLLHFEDFGVTNAKRLLDKYHDTHANPAFASFPIRIVHRQGTGAVTLACIMSAVGVTKTKLADQRFVIFGAGSAGLGIARQLRDGIVAIDGLSKEDANKQFWLIDRAGLLKQSLGVEQIRDGLQEFVRPDDEWTDAVTGENGEVGLLEVVKRVRPTVLIGTSTSPGAFTEEIVRAMAEGTERPIILPLSNPSRLHEVKPQDANDWTGGKALIATGSPFPPIKQPGGKNYIVAECNNALIYPGLGLGAMLSKARTLTDTMIIAGARRLAALAPALADPDDALLPEFGDAPRVNLEVAVAVVEQAVREGSAGVRWAEDEVRARVRRAQWRPLYGEYVYDPQGET
ncbi:uncharacterized protein BXZ73DRAFT_103959 [Epithele typhae]|uniref:uncharacterized protein n=1 Tax=Epithele typhae TaxID=378194 RepID=UPI002007D02D|nr:uncharacterized protein BXZ73DRAFT_103959 [Epithele typhae]KAH9923161.1 hypothetical protein BXZ73DRAFT_103959 [Epithele typhae]